MHPLLATYDVSYDAARAEFLRVIEGDPEDPANHLCQWLADPDLSRHFAFADGQYASMMRTLEGCVGLFRTIRHAIHDDGEIAFVQTKKRGPKFIFDDRHDPAFETRFAAACAHELRHLPKLNHGALQDGFTIIGYLDDSFAFTRAYTLHQEAREKLSQRLAEFRKK
jgi:hypothetical protein